MVLGSRPARRVSPSRWVCLAALLVAVLSAAPAAGGPEQTVLVGVEWLEREDLRGLVAAGGLVRYSFDRSAVVQVPESFLPVVRDRFRGVVVMDTLRSGVVHWLVVPSAPAALDSISLYGKSLRLGQDGVYLVAVPEGTEQRLSRFVFSMMPLPERVELPALLPRKAPPSLGERAAGTVGIWPQRLDLMRQVADGVSTDSIKAIVHLVSVDDSTSLLRSRYTFRSEAAWIPHMLRERMKSALAGAGIDSFHAFATRIFGVDTVLYNVVGLVPGRVPGSGKFVVCAHYDDTANRTTYPEPGRYWQYWTDPAPGADDNGTGVASVLECARVLSGLQFDFDLEFVLFCAEEQGLFGSKDYVAENAALGSNIIGALNFDMHGFRGVADSTFLRTNVSSGWLTDHVTSVAQVLYDSIGLSVGVTTIDGTYDASDHAAFWMRGYDAVHFFEHSSLPPVYPYYHTIYDTEEKLNFDLCRKVAAVGAASLAYFAQTTDPWDLEVLSGDLQFRLQGSAVPVSKAVSGQVLTIIPSFHNVGGPSAESLSVHVRVYDGDPANGGALIGERLIEGKLYSGAGPVVEPFDWLLTDRDVGEHEIYIVVDAGPGEANVSNNKASVPFVVSSTSLAVRYSFVFPNPMRPAETGGRLRFFLTKEANTVELDIYDISGRRVGGCRDGSCGGTALEPGDGNEIDLAAVTEAARLASGVYSYRLRVNDGAGDKVSFGRFAVVR